MYMSSFGIPIVSKIEGGTFEDLKKSITEKIEKNPEFSDRLRVKNKSEFRSKEPANKN